MSGSYCCRIFDGVILIRQKMFIIFLVLVGPGACVLMGSPLEFPEADGAVLHDSEVGILDYSRVARFSAIYIDGIYASDSLLMEVTTTVMHGSDQANIPSS
jgi:hypothetical protein